MANQVFRFSYGADAVPQDEGQITDWAEAEANRLTGGAVGRVVHFIEQHSRDPEYRLTISVPELAAEALAALRGHGAEPEFEEPGRPYAEGNAIILPGSFQVVKFGCWIDPRSVQDNPERLMLLCSAVNEAIAELPEEARDWMNWSWMDHDEDNGTFTITWGEPEGEIEVFWLPPGTLTGSYSLN